MEEPCVPQRMSYIILIPFLVIGVLGGVQAKEAWGHGDKRPYRRDYEGPGTGDIA